MMIIIVFLFLFQLFSGTTELMTGEISRENILTRDLGDNEYLFLVGDSIEILGRNIKVERVTENEDVILSVNGKRMSISSKIIVEDDLEIRKIAAKKNFAVLEIK